MKDLCLVKLGGSIITDTSMPNTAKPKEIKRLVNEIKQSGKTNIVIGHGSGSFGHVPAKKYRIQEGITSRSSMKGASITQYAAAELHMLILKELVSNNVNALSFRPSSGMARKGKMYAWDISPMEKAIKKGFVPLTMGDLVIDSAKGITIISTEGVFEYIASKLKPSRIIVAGDTDGVFTANPKVDKMAKLIPKISSKNIRQAMKGAGASLKTDVTGGMATKLSYLYSISKKYGTTCQIINATVPGRLQSALSGKKAKGTIIKA